MGEGEKKEEKREEKREETPTAKEKEEKKETMFDGSGREIESSSSEKPNNSTEEEEKKETQPKAERESVAKTEGEEEKGAEIATEKKESGSDTDVASKTEESENEEDKATKKEEKKEDAQGNPIDEEGRLVLEEMKSIDELTDEDFTNPTRTVQLPKIPENVDAAIGANGKPVIIKRNIFEKNKNHHKELNAEDGRNIINRALYNPDIVATNQPITRPDYKVVIQTGDKNAAVVLDVYQGKDNVEVVGWRQMEANGLERLKRQVKREGGQLLILSPSDGSAAALSALPSDSQGKATESEGEKQEEKEKKEAKPKAKSKGKKITPKAQTTRKFKEPKDFKDFVGPKDERRFLRSVFYDKEKGKVVATDAHIMIAIDHDMNGEKNAGQVVEARTGWVFLEPKETEQPVLDKNGKKIIDKDGHALMEKKPNPNAGKPIAYPNWEGLIPTDKPTNTIRLTDEARTRLKGLCGTELKDHLDELILIKVGDAYFRPEWLMKAMKGTEFLEGDVRIETRGQTHPMVIRGDNGIMLLMPANIGDSNEYIDGTTGDIKETATDNTISTAAEKLTETTAKLRMAEAALEATHNATFNKKEEVTKAIEAYKKSLEKKVTAWTMANGGEMAADEDVEAKRKEIYKEETKVIDNNNLEFVQLLYDRKSGLKGSDWSDGKIAAKVINEYGNQEEWRYSRGREGREEREGRETEAEHRAKEKAETPREKMRQKMIGRRAQAIGGKLGVKVNTRHSKPGEPGVRAMYDTRTGEVTVLTDNIHGLRELESVMAHEIVAHGGMRALMGRRFDGFCDRVWNAMSAQAKWQMGGYAWDGMTRRQKSAILGEEAQEKKWDDLTGEEKRKALRDTGVQRIAADELMAHRAERKSLKDESLMERIVGWIREMLGRIGLTNMTNEDVDHLLRESRRNLEGKTNTASLAENGLSEGEAKEETEVRYSRVTDKEKIAELENGKKVTVYRAMQMVDGKLYPPMAGKVDGKWQEAAETDVWYQVDERPDLLDKNGKFKLNKGNGSTPTPVAYNPYWHTSRSPLNDQFSSAWKRGELVTVECEVPESELTSGYKAEGAKDAVGEREWKEGPVSRELNKQGKPRRVILSRYVKVKRVLPESEVAQAIADRLKGTGIEIPFNTVTPQLREALEKEGVKIDAPEKNNAGDASRAAYEEWKKEGIRYSRTTDITKIGLRKLQEGETSYVERRYRETGAFDFMGSEKIESVDDVAFIFHNLKDEAVENSFVALVKDGKPTIIHMSMGSYGKSLVCPEHAFVAIKEIDPDEIWFVHNHPSGTLTASRPDVNSYNKLREIFGNKLQAGIIIDTTSGKYGVFDDEGSIETSMREAKGDEVKLKTYQFSKQVFAKDWNPATAFRIRSSMDVASFVSSHRLGEHDQMSLIVGNLANYVVGNIFLPYTKIEDNKEWLIKAADEIAYYVNQMGGVGAFLYGNAKMVSNTTSKLRDLLDQRNVHLLDVVEVFGDSYRSANDLGYMEPEAEYGKEESDVRYSRVGTNFVRSKNGKSLIGMHNISEEKLRKAMKMGGLANPSMAVIDLKNGIHTDFGEISLIPRSSLIDSKTGSNGGTYSGDAWTPTYPGVERNLTDAGREHIKEMAKAESKGDEELRRRLEGAMVDYAEGNGNHLYYMFLLQKGLNPTRIQKQTKYEQEVYDEIVKIFGKEVRWYPDDMTKEQEEQLLDLMMRDYRKRQEKVMEAIKDEEKREKAFRLKMEQFREKLVSSKDGRLYMAPADTFIHDNWEDEETRRNPQTNWSKTESEASMRVIQGGLSDEFSRWTESLLDDKDIEERIFVGFTPSGKRKYLPHTIENVSRVMNSKPRENAYGNSGLNATRATLLKKMRTLSAIRKNRGLLQGDEEYKKRQKEMTDKLFELFSDLADLKKETANSFINNDIAETRLQEALPERDPVGYLNKEYGYHIEKDSDIARRIVEFKKEVSELPVKYFETKFRRPVGIDEFAAAVVPSSVGEDVRNGLQSAGLQIVEYEPNNLEDRKRAVEEAAEGDEGIRFSRRSDIEEVNRRFNEELADFTEENGINKMFYLGNPNAILLAGGVKNLPLKLHGAKLVKKIKKHGYKAESLKDLPRALQEPIAIFNNYESETNRSILTELHTEQGNILVSVDVGKGNDVDFNVIASVFGKSGDKITNWIKKGYATYMDKEKTLDYLRTSAPIADTKDNQEFDDIAKIVDEFENPKLPGEIQNDSKDEDIRYSRVSDFVPAWGSYSPLQGRSGRMTLEDFEEYAEKAKSGILVLSRTKAAEIRAMLGLPERSTKAGAKADEVKRIAKMDEKERKAAVKAMTRFLKAAMTGLRRDFKIGERG